MFQNHRHLDEIIQPGITVYLIGEHLVAILTHHIATNNSKYMIQSYEIMLPSQAFLDGRSSPWRRLIQVGVMTGLSQARQTVDSI